MKWGRLAPLAAPLAALLRNLFRRPRAERDLTAEVDSYLEHLVAERIAAGQDPRAALRGARLELGSAAGLKEEVRDVRRGARLEQLLRDLRIGWRGLRRSPGFTAFAVVTFAMAIGGITLIGTLVNAVLIRPLPYPDSDRLMMVLEASAANPVGGFSVAAPNFEDWERRNRVFRAMALYEYQGYNLSGDGEPEQVGGLRATHRLFEVLRVAPSLGRGFVADDDIGRNGPVVVLSHRLWQRRYGGDSTLVGRAIRINKTPHVVIGVMPAGFSFPSIGQDLWVPIGITEEDRGRGSHSFFSVARLEDGVPFEQARAEIRSIGDQLAREYPAANAGETATVIAMRDFWLNDVSRTLRILMVAMGLVVVIAAANVASLLVARGISRRRELAARLALGGTRRRVAAQLVTETMLLALIGGSVGLAAAAAALPALGLALPTMLRNVPFRDLSRIAIDLPVFGAALAAAIAVGLAAGTIPALVVIPAGPGEVLREAGTRSATARRGHLLRNALVAIEVTLAMVVLVGAGLLIASVRLQLEVDPGLDPARVMAMELALPQPDSYGVPTRPNFCTELEDRLGGGSVIEAVSAVSHLPLSGARAGRSFVVEGHETGTSENLPSGAYSVVCPGYFATLGIPTTAGRDFQPTDRVGAPPVVIINESLRAKYFAGENPIGRRIRFGRFDTTDSPWVTVVGVVGDVHHDGLSAGYWPHLYRAYTQTVWPSMAVVARASGTPAAVVEPIRTALARIAPDEPIGSPITMADVVARSLGPVRFPMVIFSIFAVVALVLAVVGIFGVASQSVAQRTRELAIRRAVGATEGHLYRLVIGQAMSPVGIGITLGIAVALGSTRVLQGLLFGVTPTSVPTFGGVAAGLATIALVACWLPARRAGTVDPITVLREE